MTYDKALVAVIIGGLLGALSFWKQLSLPMVNETSVMESKTDG